MVLHLSVIIVALFLSTSSFAAPPKMNCATTDVSGTELSGFIKRHHDELIHYDVKDSNGNFRVSDAKSQVIRNDLCRILKLGGTGCDLKLSADREGSVLGDGVLSILDQGEPVFIEPSGKRMHRCTPKPDEVEYGISDTGERKILILTRADGVIFGAMFDAEGEAEQVRGSISRGSTQTLFTSDMKTININRLKSTFDSAGKSYVKPSADQTDQAFGYSSTAAPSAGSPIGTAR